MSRLFTLRTLVTAGVVAAGAAGLDAAVPFAGRYGLRPPDHGPILGPGATLTYSAQHLRTSRPTPTLQVPSRTRASWACCGTAWTWPTPFIRRRCSPMA